ncbi:hypothetical protein DRE_00393 [Drechslerella stenobrocha 248]|uniref:Major facilitator superfamily (MFS) profile domain-containing protein n=1 Tax=Drechslerella stenobrocha 248 TaxID=1043628 RepID=W7IEH3_9PEZI|nr:hypothetical protein DRE_00393 [Drechslerella stenobrocha 248]
MSFEEKPPITTPPRDRSSSPEDGAALDPELERRLVRRLDLYIIPVAMVLYMLAFLDRINIGNARLYGLEEDLGIAGTLGYQTAVSLLFVTYLLFEVPSNLVLKKFRPSRWIAFITTAWGIAATCTGLVQSYGGLIACRLILGLFEAGLFPGLTVYLTFWYTKKEIALRIALLFMSAAIAGASGGLLAYCIGFMDGIAGMRGWRWIMIIEGIPTILVGLATPWLLSDGPANARFLNPEERIIMTKRMQEEHGASVKVEEKLKKQDVIACFTDWKPYMFALGCWGMVTMLYGYSINLPIIIKGLGAHWPNPVVQALTIPCYTVGAGVYVATAWWSDRTQRRGLVVMIAPIFSIAGYVILISPSPPGVKYFGCFLIASGLYVAVGIPLAWNVVNIPRYGKKATASGFQLTVGNASGIMSAYLYPAVDGPRYIKGHAVTISMIAVGTMAYGTVLAYYIYENKARDEGKRDYLLEGKTEAEIAEMGDDSPRFRYVT